MILGEKKIEFLNFFKVIVITLKQGLVTFQFHFYDKVVLQDVF